MTVRIPAHEVLNLHLALRRAEALPADVRILSTDTVREQTAVLLRGTRRDIDAAMHVVMCTLPRAEFGAIHGQTAGLQ